MIAALALAATLSLPAAAAADGVSLSPLFSDHAVVQAGISLPVWGRADPGEEVAVSLAGKTVRGRAAADGRWRVVFDPLPAGGPFDLVAEGGTRAVAKDVLVGEVWVASGQSNMAMAVSAANGAAAEAAAAKFPSIRMFTQAWAPRADPAADAQGSWAVCSPETVGAFSAAAYFFAREVHRSLGIPVGIVHTSVGGTPAEAWTPRDALAAEPSLRPMLERWDRAARDYDPARAEAEHRRDMERWRKQAEEAKRKGKPVPPEPAPPQDPRASPWAPGALWNGMVAPLVPLAARGAIWYQGESNAGKAYQYRTLFPRMIRAWREARGDPQWPFLFVQLAGFGRVAPSGGPSAWAELREAQLMAFRDLPATGMAVAIDIGDPGDIHPKDKQEVGRRLALWALARTYGKNVPCSGPLFVDAKAEGERIRISFESALGLRTADGTELAGFAVSGADGKFFPAKARIDGDTVLVWAPDGGRPSAVRYAWADAPAAANLVNGAGLPASPFRTDSFKGVTEGKW